MLRHIFAACKIIHFFCFTLRLLSIFTSICRFSLFSLLFFLFLFRQRCCCQTHFHRANSLPFTLALPSFAIAGTRHERHKEKVTKKRKKSTFSAVEILLVYRRPKNACESRFFLRFHLLLSLIRFCSNVDALKLQIFFSFHSMAHTFLDRTQSQVNQIGCFDAFLWVWNGARFSFEMRYNHLFSGDGQFARFTRSWNKWTTERTFTLACNRSDGNSPTRPSSIQEEISCACWRRHPTFFVCLTVYNEIFMTTFDFNRLTFDRTCRQNVEQNSISKSFYVRRQLA